ncbi:hypothetical protein BH20VER1_BH20VER1_21890 [soil metagenome]
MKFTSLGAGLRLHLLSLLVAGATLAQSTATLDETARFLAGLAVDGHLAARTTDPAWQQHARAMDEAWSRKEAEQILPIRDWMLNHAETHYRTTGTMYYMFGGPDFLYANIFFPDASNYILAGLEPVGEVPDLVAMPPEQLAAELAALRTSMNSILRFQYFITKDMKQELARGGLGGTMPILYVFLARLGYTVNDVSRVSSPADGVRITFGHLAEERSQTLHYFRTDLSGGGQSAFLKWCAARGPGVSLLKAASYLLHTGGFNGVQKFLLENSRVIVQDDSGIPLRAFPKGWRVDVHGRYIPHGEMFGKYYQADLAAVFAENPGPELGFAFGYHWQKDRGVLLLATKGGAAAATPETPLRAEPVEVRKALPPGDEPTPAPNPRSRR